MICVGGVGVAALLQSCATGHYFAKSEISGKYLNVPATEFTLDKNGAVLDRNYVLVRSEKLNFPIYLYKMNEQEYSAVWMECTHQGAELSAHGEQLSCPAHGSEFDNFGHVIQGPAQSNLRTFKTLVENGVVKIQLS
ncbi:MAG TPA: Rieske (2Fe-2S) protein [Cytophaga sp.]|nr:Rieske (2Fe-2S) protein [Cytophaga sp.]